MADPLEQLVQGGDPQASLYTLQLDRPSQRLQRCGSHPGLKVQSNPIRQGCESVAGLGREWQEMATLCMYNSGSE